MEPNNFEKDFREKLNQRKIEPSDKAWDRLDAMLSIAEENKPAKKAKNKRKWMYVAASIAGFLLLGTIFFNQSKNSSEVLNTIEVQNDKNVVIEEGTQKDSVIKTIVLQKDSDKKVIAVSEQVSVKSTNQEGINRSTKSNKTIHIASNQITESSIINQNQEIQSIKNQSAVTETAAKESTDQLLVKAEKNNLADNVVKPKSKVKINANDLLNQVDGELELSFREKMIAKVNKNYQSVKVAITNRNQEE
ncbi:hypothetical protein [Flavobacterium hercynium]|uniref:Uncharacterized protein n=1 Tax=Flavobacterium hercynium TaxID=387094 RepID=A0A226HRN7_9FLAO|nr:hypothetical protein [Flavobacterium hercynium]OXA96140.1 hypothetical protein B0A66_00750 [Flavobacterium hercynium]SMP05803.1 hypothetical protein SAMN06265346_101563 [Flavobacterium hercynium]